MMIFTFCKIPSSIYNIVLNFKHNEELFINHKNVFFVYIYNNNEKEPVVEFYDMMGNQSIKIKFNSGNKKTIKIPIGSYVNSYNIQYKERILEGSLKTTFHYFKNEFLNICKINYRKVSHSNLLINLFRNNFELLREIKLLKIKENNVYAEFKNLNKEENLGQISEIFSIFGYPHNTVSLSDGYQFLIYYGIHQCSKGNSSGIMLIKINSYGQISSVDLFANSCKCKEEDNRIIIYNKNNNL